MSSPLRTVGGVTPIKKRTATKAGEHGVEATSTAGRRGGFSQAGPKGANVHGYNVATRFSPSVYTPPNSLGASLKGKTTTSKGNGKGKGPTITGDYYDYRDYSQHSIVNVDGAGVENASKLQSYKKAWNKLPVAERIAKYGTDDNSGYKKFVVSAEKWWEDEAKKKGMSVADFKAWHTSGTGGGGGKSKTKINVKQIQK